MLSEDKELRTIGRKTRIPYKADYEAYLEYLSRGLSGRKEKVMATFREWNELFFPEPNAESGDQDGSRRAMASLNDQLTEEEDEDGENEDEGNDEDEDDDEDEEGGAGA